MALARALLPSPPALLLCDEATANVDEATDAIVHDILLDLKATVLAHLAASPTAA